MRHQLIAIVCLANIFTSSASAEIAVQSCREVGDWYKKKIELQFDADSKSIVPFFKMEKDGLSISNTEKTPLYVLRNIAPGEKTSKEFKRYVLDGTNFYKASRISNGKAELAEPLLTGERLRTSDDVWFQEAEDLSGDLTYFEFRDSPLRLGAENIDFWNLGPNKIILPPLFTKVRPNPKSIPRPIKFKVGFLYKEKVMIVPGILKFELKSENECTSDYE